MSNFFLQKQKFVYKEIVYFDTRGRLAHCKCKNAAWTRVRGRQAEVEGVYFCFGIYFSKIFFIKTFFVNFFFNIFFQHFFFKLFFPNFFFQFFFPNFFFKFFFPKFFSHHTRREKFNSFPATHNILLYFFQILLYLIEVLKLTWSSNFFCKLFFSKFFVLKLTWSWFFYYFYMHVYFDVYMKILKMAINFHYYTFILMGYM